MALLRMNSASSMGSYRQSSPEDDEAAPGDAEAIQTETETSPLRTGLFGVLYTLTKEKLDDSVRMALINAIVEFISIMTIMLQNKYPWSTNYNLWIWKIIWYITLQNPVSAWGLNLYLAIFYIFMALLVVVCGICVWVAWCFKNDNFPYLWPVKFVRVVGSIFFTTFYILSLNVYMVMLQCQPKDGVWVQVQFNDTQCFAFPFLIHLVLSVFGSLLFTAIAFLLVMADHDLNPLSRTISGSPNSLCEMKSIIAKFLLTFADMCLFPWPKLQTVCLLLCLVPMLYWHLDAVPYYTAWINCLLGGFGFVYVWTAICLTWLMYIVRDAHFVAIGVGVVYEWTVDNPDDTRMATMAMIGGLAPSFLLGCVVTYMRMYYLHKVGMKFAYLKPGMNSKRIHRFASDMEADLASRVCRVWDLQHQPIPEALDLGEAILTAGQAQFPDSALLAVSVSNFLFEVRGMSSAGWRQLDMAKKLDPNLSFKFSMFVREQESRQKAAVTQSGDASTDLVSYVEFQRNYKLLTAYHRATLAAMRDFWRLMLSNQIDFVVLLKIFKRFEEMERQADRTFRSALDKYPKSVKLLRSYAAFLEHVKNEPYAALKYFNEAEKQAEQQDSAEVNEVQTDSVMSANAYAAITMNASGTVQSVNKLALAMLGYERGELEGENIKVIMPPFFAQRHDGYLRRYVATGRTNIVDTVRDILVMHKDKYVFPCRLLVKKVSGNREDAIFNGRFKPVPSDPMAIRTWMLLDGVLMCVEQAFGDFSGWSGKDLENRSLASFFAEDDTIVLSIAKLSVAVQAAQDNAPLPITAAADAAADSGVGNNNTGSARLVRKSTKADLETSEAVLVPGWEHGSVLATLEVHMRHKYAEDIQCSLSFEVAGSKDMRMLLATIRPVALAVVALLVLDSKGVVQHANSKAAALWGYKDRQAMHGLELAGLMVAPFGQLHQHFLKAVQQQHGRGRIPPSSCRSGLSQVLLAANGAHVPARLTISSKDTDSTDLNGINTGGAHRWIVKAERVTPEAAADERRLTLTLSTDGVVVSVGDSPRALFGFDVAEMVGRPLHAVIDSFAIWRKTGQATDTALAALIRVSVSRPNTAWRVGVLFPNVEAVKAAAKASNSRSPHVPAFMQLEVTDAGAIHLQLWRQELVSGVIEVNRQMLVVKADVAAGLVFGVPYTEMLGHHLTRYLRVGQGVSQLEDLLIDVNSKGSSGNRRGGMKRNNNGPVVGDRQTLNATHDDAKTNSVIFQAILRSPNHPRLVACVRGAVATTGSAEMLRRAMDRQAGALDFRNTDASTAVPAEGTSMAIAGSAQRRLSAGPGTQAAGPSGSGRLRAALNNKGLRGAMEHDDSGKLTDDSAFVRKQGVKRTSDGDSDALVKSDPQVFADDDYGGSVSPAVASHPAARRGSSEKRQVSMNIRALGEAPREDEGSEKDHRLRRDDRDPDDDDDHDRTKGDDDRVAPSEGSASEGSSGGGNFRRGRRLRKLDKLMATMATTRAVHRMRWHVWILLAVLLAVHLGGFLVLLLDLNSQANYIENIAGAVEVMDRMHLATTYARCGEAAYRAVGFTTANLPALASLLAVQLNRFEVIHTDLYIGFNAKPSLVHATPRLTAVWGNVTLLAERIYADTRPPTYTNQVASLLGMGNKFLANAKDVMFYMQQAPKANSSMSALPAWRYLGDNGPGELNRGYLQLLDALTNAAVDSVDSFQTTLMILLIVEGVGLTVCAMVYVVYLSYQVARARSALFMVFLAVPSSIARSMVARSVTLSKEAGHVKAGVLDQKHGDGHSDDDEEEEHEDLDVQQGVPRVGSQTYDRTGSMTYSRNNSMTMPQRMGSMTFQDSSIVKGTGAVATGSRSHQRPATTLDRGIQFTSFVAPRGGGGGGKSQDLFRGKELVRTTTDVWKLCWPFSLWAVAVIVAYAITITRLAGIQHALVEMNLMGRVQDQTSRVMYYAAEATLAVGNATKQTAQAQLTSEAALLDEVYSTSLYGHPTSGRPATALNGTLDPTYVTSGSVYLTEAYPTLLFQTTACQRRSSGQCVAPDDTFYQVSRNGMDIMLRRLIMEAQLLGNDSLADLKPNSSRWSFVWRVGLQDLRDGMDGLVGTYQNTCSAAFAGSSTVFILLEVLSWVLALVFLLLIFRPFLASTHGEAHRVAKLLTHLPTEVDVEGMVKTTWAVVMQQKLDVADSKEEAKKAKDSRAAPPASSSSNAASGGGGGGGFFSFFSRNKGAASSSPHGAEVAALPPSAGVGGGGKGKKGGGSSGVGGDLQMGQRHPMAGGGGDGKGSSNGSSRFGAGGSSGRQHVGIDMSRGHHMVGAVDEFDSHPGGGCTFLNAVAAADRGGRASGSRFSPDGAANVPDSPPPPPAKAHPGAAAAAAAAKARRGPARDDSSSSLLPLVAPDSPGAASPGGHPSPSAATPLFTRTSFSIDSPTRGNSVRAPPGALTSGSAALGGSYRDGGGRPGGTGGTAGGTTGSPRRDAPSRDNSRMGLLANMHVASFEREHSGSLLLAAGSSSQQRTHSGALLLPAVEADSPPASPRGGGRGPMSSLSRSGSQRPLLQVTQVAVGSRPNSPQQLAPPGAPK